MGVPPERGAFDIASLVDPQIVRATEFYAAVLAPQRISTMTPMALPLGPGFDTGGVSIAFDGRDDDAPRASIELLNLMAPYLRRAIQVNLKLQATERRATSLVAVLDRMPEAVLLASQSALVLFANRCADDLLTGADGLAMRDGALVASRPSDTRTLHRRIGNAGRAARHLLPNGPDALAVQRPSGLPALSVLIAPVGELHADLALQDRAAALLIVTDPQEREAPASQAVERLCELFRFTPTEAKVAVCIAMDMSGPEVAAHLGIGPGTVHAHLKGVFAKSGVRRQSSLARLLTRTGALDLA